MWRARVVAVLAAVAVTVPLYAQPAAAAPRLTLSKSSGLSNGTQITVNGSGFTANLKQIAIGQCIADPVGPTDCNLAGGAQFVNADGSGKIPAVTLKLAAKFGSFDCTKRQCVVAAQILPSSASDDVVKANRASVKISFGAASSPKPGTSTSPESLAKTGPGDEHWVLVLGGSALLLPGIGLLLLLPRRRRAAA